MALDFTLKTAYEVTHGTIMEIKVDTQLLTTYMNKSIYPVIYFDQTRYVLDLAKMLVFEQQVDTNQSLYNFLSERLTPTKISRYQTFNIPLPNIVTKKYTNRINTIDAEAADDYKLAYTSVRMPEIRNDVHQIESLSDIVISSERHNLNNSLVAVNGVFHATRYHNGELYALDGNTNIRNCGEARIVVMDTTSVGGHIVIPLSVNYYSNTVTQDPRCGVYITLPKRFDLTRSTPLLVIDGVMHPLDNTYAVVGPRRLKIHTNRMDLIHEFLHNPNTVYLHDKDGRYKNPYIPSQPLTPERPSVVDRITQYLNTLEYFPKRSTTTTQQAVVEYRTTPMYKDAPSVSEKITYALTHATKLNSIQRGDAKSAIVSLQYNTLYRAATGITRTITMPSLTSAEFVMSRVFSEHSFIVLLNTTKLYRNVMPLIPTGHNAYEKRGFDSPRGLALHNKHLAVPYRVLPGFSGQYSITTDAYLHKVNLYKTSILPSVIASPYYDQKVQTPKHSLEMVELFTA